MIAALVSVAAETRALEIESSECDSREFRARGVQGENLRGISGPAHDALEGGETPDPAQEKLTFGVTCWYDGCGFDI